jgi:uncharacterized membrane protein
MSKGEKTKRKKPMIRLVKTGYNNGDTVPISAIYECSDCWNITAFKQGEKFLPCEECENPDDDQHWFRTNQFLHFVTKNLNTEFDNIETFSLQLADKIAEVAGNIWFALAHIIWFLFWIYVNNGHTLFGLGVFDPYPYGLLTMTVSLEAIFLSLFILISQNRQSQKSELRAELDYQVNLKTEKDVAEILSILRDMHEDVQDIEDDTSELLGETSSVKHKNPKTSRTEKTHEMLTDAGIRIIRNHKKK